MIEVIKHGQKKFKATCAHCGCEFTYELGDLDSGILYCPDCSHRYCHYPILEVGDLSHYQPNSTVVYKPNTTGYPPTTMLFNTTTGAKEAETILGDVYTTEKDLETQQMFKDQMSKKPFIPCTDKE